jgi:hypothetical protein
MKKQALVKTSPQPIAKATLNPAMFAADAGAGTENTSAESFAIPFLMVLQKGSPQVDEASGRALKGAKAGMLYENVSNELVDGKAGVLLVPCAYRRVYIRWSESQGFQGELLPEEVNRLQQTGKIVEIKNRLYMADSAGKADPDESDRIADTRNHYVLIVDRNGKASHQALLSLSSTQIKKSRALMTALVSVKMEVEGELITPPTFANLVRATTVPESNDKGTWFGWNFQLEGFLQSPEIYAAARQFHRTVTEGQVAHRYTEPEKDSEAPKKF